MFYKCNMDKLCNNDTATPSGNIINFVHEINI